LEEWGKLLGDVPTAGAILDRFLHHAQTIAITGRSYLTNNQVAGEAATALGNYGSLARIAFPKIVPLLKLWKSKDRNVLVLTAEDRDLLAAARQALKKIDPEAAAKIGVK
jgi:hypothetical protein